MIKNDLKINFDRLKETINESSKIGVIPGKGLCRLALSEEDKKMRNVFMKWMEGDNLETRFDDFGNMYGRRKGTHELPPVLVGSHLDTQPNGGRFDGVLGVLVALEVIRTLNDYNIKTYRPVELVNFTNEEGARFEPPLLGSGGLTRIFDKEFIYSRKDSDGLIFEEELQKIGYKGNEGNRARDIHSFIELHIEQGPILEKEQISVGVVEGIKGMTWLEIKVRGEGGHAGPTPMNMRKDAQMAMSQMVTHIEAKGKSYNTELSLTIGRINVSPNVINCIPEEVVFSLDVRHIDDNIRQNFIEELLEDLRKISDERKVKLVTNKLWKVDTTLFNSNIIDIIEKNTEKLGYSCKRLYSGAGHDAKYINDIAPTGMIFLPSVGGRSHVESELTLDKDIKQGADVLLNCILQMSGIENQL